MAKLLILLFAFVCLHGTTGDVSVNEYIYWKKADISAWHKFFPSRALEEERETLGAALAAVQSLASGLNDSLSSVVAFQAQELITAQLLMEGTDAEGCVNGIANFMQDAIDIELETYLDCAADAQSKLLRLNSTWTKAQVTYLAAYQRALSGIDACAKTYPNKDSISRLKSCVESMNTNYFMAANKTQNAVFPSPSMSYFQQTVVKCASTAAQNVAAKGWKFLGMLVECSKLSSTIDPVEYAEELNKWEGYNDTLQNQINVSQGKNYDQVLSVESEMTKYYSLQKEALEQYVIESRGLDFYLNKTYLLLCDYYNTVTAAALDNPGDTECTDEAKTALDTVASAGASKSLSCDISIVNNTKSLIAEVVNEFFYLNSLMPSIGNAALLNCFSLGHVFAPNTIAECFNLVYLEFDVEHSDRLNTIEVDVAVLEGYASSFFSGNELPCGGSSLRRLLLGGENALYNLQRCLYTSSGATYAVSTPRTNVTTTTWYTEPATPAYTELTTARNYRYDINGTIGTIGTIGNKFDEEVEEVEET